MDVLFSWQHLDVWLLAFIALTVGNISRQLQYIASRIDALSERKY